jgi:hypothetical protein
MMFKKTYVEMQSNGIAHLQYFNLPSSRVRRRHVHDY